MKIACILSLAAAAAAASPAAAQERDGSAVSASQIQAAPEQGAADTPQLNQERGPVRQPFQLSDPAKSNEPVPQLTTGGDRRATPQLYRGGRTAQPSQPLSTPAEGRTGTVAPVEGADRCDAAQHGGRKVQACERVIETRSAEFTRAETSPLSPEQRLLSEQRNRTTMSDQAAARRLATGISDPDELQDQAIASVALRGLPTAQQEKKEEPAELSSDVAAIVQAITQQLASPQ